MSPLNHCCCGKALRMSPHCFCLSSYLQAILHVHAPHDVHMLNSVLASHQHRQHNSGSRGGLPTFGFLYAPSKLSAGGHDSSVSEEQQQGSVKPSLQVG